MMFGREPGNYGKTAQDKGRRRILCVRLHPEKDRQDR